MNSSMPDKKAEFVVTDRRKFTSDGDLRPQAEPAESEQAAESRQEPPAPELEARKEQKEQRAQDPPVPPAPSAAEQKAQHTAYRQSGQWIDDRLRADLGGRRPEEFQVSFERFVATLYMSALMQLGLAHPEGQAPPPPDIITARQTIDTLGMLAEKTRGNLSDSEKNLLDNVLYELRMAFVELTNALSQPPQPGGGAK